MDLSHLRRFGCVAYLHIPSERRQRSAKYQARAVKGYFVGYQRGGQTNYRIWIPGSGVIKESPHVTFNETEVYNMRLSSIFVSTIGRSWPATT